MKDGKITQSGKYEEILNSGSDFMELVGAHEKALSSLNSTETMPTSENVKLNEVKDSGANEKEVNHKLEVKKEEIVEPKAQLVQEEEREKGRVGFMVYWKYITTAYGGTLVLFILAAQILFQSLQVGSNYWMAWATPVSKDAKPPVKGSTLILVYVSLAIGSSLCVLVRAVLLAAAGFKTATILFNKMHMCIFRAPMSFFDSTPSGRILNRVRLHKSIFIILPLHSSHNVLF